MLDSRFSGGADAGEKATFSLTHGEARREKWVYVHLRKVVSAPFGAIPACFPFYGRRSGLTDFVDGTTQTMRPCRPLWGHPWMLTIVPRRCRRRRVNGGCTQTGNSFYMIIEMDGKGESQNERARRRGRADGVSRLFIFQAAYCIGRSHGERLDDTGH